MKKKSSVVVTLALLGSAGILSSCGEDPVQTAMFKDASSCVASGQYTQKQCDDAIAAANIDNQKNAPAFSSQKDCEESFGAAACQQTSSHPTSASNGGSSWVPLMSGFLMGHLMSNGRQSVYPQAVYQDKDRKYMNGGGGFIARNFGSVKVTPDSSTRGSSVNSSPIRTTTVSRGGFGRSSFSVSS
jgi:uncharacterized protein YgiB involved in biofilm formation